MQTMRWNWWWMPLEWTSIWCLCWYKTVRLLFLKDLVLLILVTKDVGLSPKTNVTNINVDDFIDQVEHNFWSPEIVQNLFQQSTKVDMCASEQQGIRLQKIIMRMWSRICHKCGSKCQSRLVQYQIFPDKTWFRGKNMDYPKTNDSPIYSNLECLCKW